MRPLPRLTIPVATAALAAALLSVPHALPGTAAGVPADSVLRPSAKATPALKVKTLVSGLDLVWDVKPVDAQTLLFTQRNRATLSRLRDGQVRTVRNFPSAKIWVAGETGLLGLEVDPRFEQNQRVYTCQGWRKGGGGQDIRVIAWQLNKAATKVLKKQTLVRGLPTSSGRHGGCRLLIESTNGSLMVGTGDAAIGANPRNLDSLGGKTLRLSRFTGKPWRTNTFAKASSPRRYVHTYGHRNVQGLAERRDGTVWSMEHGPDRDDEVNLLRNGGDYGWHPVPGYNESVPMTDQSLPGKQVNARWSSGSSTVATSGGTFIYGRKWGSYNGTLVVACLRTSQMLFLKFNADGTFQGRRAPAELQRYGRLRTATQLANGDLLVTTSNGGGGDVILRVRPA
jgi:glucose/arabinose dehydrogenase